MAISIVRYDSARRRLWLVGQRCHHGATGVVLAGAGATALVTLRSRGLAGLIAAGALLMAHDWNDRAIWFTRGHQNQP